MKFMLISLTFLAILCSVSLGAMPNELILYMSFDNNTIDGKTVKDLSKYGNNGTMLGAPKFDKGHQGDAILFNGASDGVEMEPSESFSKTINQMSLAAWVKPSIDAQIEVITKWDGLLNGVIHFELQAGGIIRFCMRSGNNAADAIMTDSKTPGGAFSTNEWSHIAEVYDGKAAKIYVNGEEVLNVACSGTMRDNENMKWWIGCLYGTQGRWFGGLIDEVSIWSKALTPDEVKKSMDGTLINASVEKAGKIATTWGYLRQ